MRKSRPRCAHTVLSRHCSHNAGAPSHAVPPVPRACMHGRRVEISSDYWTGVQVFRDAGSQAGVRFPDNLMLPKSDWGVDAPPGADELLVRQQGPARLFRLREWNTPMQLANSDGPHATPARDLGDKHCSEQHSNEISCTVPVRSRRTGTGRGSRTSCWAQPSFP